MRQFVDLLDELETVAAGPVADPAIAAEEFVALRAAIDRLEAEASRRLALLDERRGYAADGYPSATAFVKHRCRTTGGRAKRMVAEARALDQMAITRKLFASGDLSFDQARVLIRAHEAEPDAFAGFEAELCDVARAAPWVATLSRAVAYWRQAVSEVSDGADESVRDRRYLYCSRTLDGMFKLDGLLDPEAGEMVLSALDGATPPRREGDTRTPAQRRADALADVIAGPARAHLVVHVSNETLGDRQPKLSETGSGAVLSAETLRRLACDSSLNRVLFEGESQPLDVGRTTRVIPAGLRRAVAARDRHCVFPGCDRPERWCDAHHIQHWADGGSTAVDNLALLCRHHHTVVHEGGFGMSGRASEMAFTRPDGSRLPP